MKSGRKLSKDEEAALRVMRKSRIVQNWVLGELRAYQVDPGSPEGRVFIEERSSELAERLISQ